MTRQLVAIVLAVALAGGAAGGAGKAPAGPAHHRGPGGAMAAQADAAHRKI